LVRIRGDAKRKLVTAARLAKDLALRVRQGPASFLSSVRGREANDLVGAGFNRRGSGDIIAAFPPSTPKHF